MEVEAWHDTFHIPKKTLRILFYKIYRFLGKHLMQTYPLIEDCARCKDCGRNVHDFLVPDKLWKEVNGSEAGVLCYDCFCDRADRLFRFKWRMKTDGIEFVWNASFGDWALEE